jgi:hypothetical protein
MGTDLPLAFGLTPTFWVACAIAAIVGLSVGGFVAATSAEARENWLFVLLGSALAGPIFVFGLAGLVALLFSDSS